MHRAVQADTHGVPAARQGPQQEAPGVMRVCSSCGRENPDDRDFCECGEYLRWDPTGVVQAITPEMVEQAVEQAGPPAGAAAAAPPPPDAREPQVSQAAPPPAPPGNGHGNGHGSAAAAPPPP